MSQKARKQGAVQLQWDLTDRILYLKSPTFANKEANLQNVGLLVVGSY